MLTMLKAFTLSTNHPLTTAQLRGAARLWNRKTNLKPTQGLANSNFLEARSTSNIRVKVSSLPNEHVILRRCQGCILWCHRTCQLHERTLIRYSAASKQ